MGGFEAYRNFLYWLFSGKEYGCFAEVLEDGTEFCMSLTDLMAYLAPVTVSQKMGMTKKGFMKEYFDVGYVMKKMDEVVSSHINCDDNQKAPIITNAAIFMLDTVHRVPLNKSSTQKDRAKPTLSHMNEESFQRMREKSKEPRKDNLFIVDSHQLERYPLDGDTIWRSVNLKLQLYRLVTLHVLHARVKPDTVLLMDGGVVFSTEEYKNFRTHIEYELQLAEGMSEFEKEFIMSQCVTNSPEFMTRQMVFGDAPVFNRKGFRATGIGEADIKILPYIKRDDGNKKFLVINQDTDVIFILLLHMKTFLKHDESDDEYEIWIDTRSPNLNASIQPYRFINVKRLYYAIKKLFQEEFPLIRYPIETFCFLAFSLKTDFTRKFSDTLQITPAFFWNWFSQLHTLKEDYIPFTEPPKTTRGKVKGTRVRVVKKKLHGSLNTAIQYDMIKKRFILKHNAIAQFYQFLCQMKLLDIRKELNLSNGAYDYGTDDFILPIDELLLFGREVQERLDLFRQYEEEKEAESEKFFQIAKRPAPEHEDLSLPEKRFKPSSSLLKKSNTFVKISIIDSEEDEPSPTTNTTYTTKGVKKVISSTMRSYLVRNEKKLKQFSKLASVNEYFGILPQNDMLARIYRIEWYISYCNDGWHKLIECTEMAKHDPSLSQWGWKMREITEEEEYQRALNSSYYHAVFNPHSPHLYQLFEVLETNEVSHKRTYF